LGFTIFANLRLAAVRVGFCGREMVIKPLLAAERFFHLNPRG
jgi:hypothetical protein